MYNTVKEMHVAIDMELQHINSNRKQSITPYHKDMVLNQAVLQFVENRTNPKTNIKQEGLEDTQKRYDDIRELKRSLVLPTMIDNDKVFIILPHDYYKLIGAGCRLRYYKVDKPKPNKKVVIKYHTLPFKDDNSGKYTDLKLERKPFNSTLWDNVIDFSKYNFSTFHSPDSKFIIINNIIEEKNIFWESWNNTYNSNRLIILDEGYGSYRFSYSNVISLSKYNQVEYAAYSSFSGDTIVPIDLISSEYEFGVLGNYYMSKNKHLNPSGVIEGNRLYVQETDDFIALFIAVNYIKKPRLINHRSNQICELSVNREIVNIAVQKLKSYIKDEGYQHTVNENQLME